MNDQNLSIVFQNYISKFDEMNDSKHHETYKWEAVRHFQDSWDLEADDFAAMFKKSVGATDNLINNRIMQPTSGILELARQEPETVRTLFRTLFAADGGDLGLRQERAAAFVSEANQLLEKYAPGKWKFEQGHANGHPLSESAIPGRQLYLQGDASPHLWPLYGVWP